jgi:hypothetical protein
MKSLKALVIGSVLAVSPIQSHSASYSVSGLITASEHLAGGEIEKGGGRFVARVSQCSWTIHFDPLSSVGAVITAGSDGKQILKVARLRNPPPALITNKVILVSAAVQPGPVPSGYPPFVPAIWAAYCSSCYLDAHEQDIIPFYLNAKEKRAITAEIARNQDILKLPRRIVFMRSESVQLPPFVPGSKGVNRILTNAVFSVTTTTNVDGLVYPLSFKVELFKANRFAVSTKDQIIPTLTLVGRTEKVEPADAELDWKPVLGEDQIEFVDNRFEPSENQQFEFCYTTNRWLNDEEVKALPNFPVYNAVRPSIIESGRPKAKPLGMISVFGSAIVSICFLLFYFRAN